MSDGVAFVDGIVQAAREVLSEGAGDLHSTSQEMLEMALIVTVRTPHPQAQDGFFLGAPTNEPWTSLYGYYSEVVLPLTVTVIALAIALLLFTGIFGTFLSGYEKSRAKRRLVIAFLFIVVWWSAGAFVLRFTDALATTIAPPPGEMADVLAENMVLQGAGTVGTAGFAAAEAGVLVVLVLAYLLRWIGLYALMVGMPLAIAFWIVDVGPFQYLSRLVGDLAMKFVPLAFITVPAAIVYRVGDLVFGVFDPVEAFGHAAAPFFLGLSFPFLVLVVSYYVFFKTPKMRHMIVEPTAGTGDRDTVEKGRTDTPYDSRLDVETGRDSSGDGETREGRDTPTPHPTAGYTSGAQTRPRYGSTEAASTSAVGGHSFRRSRRKVEDIGGDR